MLGGILGDDETTNPPDRRERPVFLETNLDVLDSNLDVLDVLLDPQLDVQELQSDEELREAGVLSSTCSAGVARTLGVG